MCIWIAGAVCCTTSILIPPLCRCVDNIDMLYHTQQVCIIEEESREQSQPCLYFQVPHIPNNMHVLPPLLHETKPQHRSNPSRHTAVPQRSFEHPPEPNTTSVLTVLRGVLTTSSVIFSGDCARCCRADLRRDRSGSVAHMRHASRKQPVNTDDTTTTTTITRNGAGVKTTHSTAAVPTAVPNKDDTTKTRNNARLDAEFGAERAVRHRVDVYIHA